MRKNYKEPMTKVIPLKQGWHLLVESYATGFKATISGYEKDDEEGAGFSQ